MVSPTQQRVIDWLATFDDQRLVHYGNWCAWSGTWWAQSICPYGLGTPKLTRATFSSLLRKGLIEDDTAYAPNVIAFPGMLDNPDLKYKHAVARQQGLPTLWKGRRRQYRLSEKGMPLAHPHVQEDLLCLTP